MKSFFLCLIFLFFFSCASDTSLSEQDTDLNKMDDLKAEITALIDNSICSTETTCNYIAFGSKACGGPTSYLVYPSSINTTTLNSKVAEFNKLQSDFNKKYGIISDCAIVNPPTSLTCENNKCVAVY